MELPRQRCSEIEKKRCKAILPRQRCSEIEKRGVKQSGFIFFVGNFDEAIAHAQQQALQQ
jgi:hypothetical protein